jgi:hypothetical protein
MDFVIRFFIRFSHNLLISNCCSYGIEESIHETTRTQNVPPSSDDQSEEASYATAQA